VKTKPKAKIHLAYLRGITDHMTQKPTLSDSQLALLVLFVCFALNMAGRGIADTYVAFLLPLEAEFGWSRSGISSVYSIYMLANGLSAPFVGILFDRWGPRVVYMTGLLVMGSAYVAGAHLTQLWQFHFTIGLAGGIGISALGMVPSTSLISRWFRTNTSTAIGIAYAGFGAGSLFVVPLAQYLIDWQGWRFAYMVLGGILIGALPIVLVLPWKRIRAGRQDPGAPAVITTTARRLSLEPLRHAMKTREFWLLAQVFFFTAFSIYIILVQTIVFLVDSGFKPLEAATAFGFAGMLSILGVSTAGFLADRFGAKRTVTISFICTFIGICLLFVLSYYPSQLALTLFVVLFGVAQGARGPIVSTISARIFPGSAQATIYGTIYACMSLGAALGAYTSGLLYDFSGTYRYGFGFSMLGILAAVAPFWTSRAIAAAQTPRA
jgi:MFS family permease